MAKKKIYEFSYRYHSGTVAWILHRLSGLALIGYLLIHIWVIHRLETPQGFDTVMKFLNQPMFKILELGLWGVILYHAINGLRIIIIDFVKGSLIQKPLFWATVAIGIILLFAGAVPFLSHLHLQ
ncbi:MAG: succinate dehydrogenase, cytochrome b556 subunit [Deltaproteobacteria bacterium]|nr:succinate dehydrogenase, cytochrome b556 subunit [Deltaproteobacteria bacterium]MCL5792477.1 succinate dehydrogenase, cytochrome b556 subunit [Deltaproteobacteria bacterium]